MSCTRRFARSGRKQQRPGAHSSTGRYEATPAFDAERARLASAAETAQLVRLVRERFPVRPRPEDRPAHLPCEPERRRDPREAGGEHDYGEAHTFFIALCRSLRNVL